MPDDSRRSDETNTRESDTPARVRRVPERDGVFEVLSNPRRRHVLHALGERSEWPLDELAERIAVDEHCGSGGASEETVDRVFASLYHVHLPLLREHEVVTFDSASNLIGRGDATERMTAALEAAEAALDAHSGGGPPTGDGPDGVG